MTDLYDISANPKDPIDREGVRKAIKWWEEILDDGDEDTPYIHVLLEAASAWLEAADDMPEAMKFEAPHSEAKAYYDLIAGQHDRTLSTIKKLLRIK